MISVTVAGRLGHDAELREYGDGKRVLVMSVASDRYDYRARKRVTDWVRVVVFGRRAETMPSITKGCAVCVRGEGYVRSRQAKDGTWRSVLEVHAEDVQVIKWAYSDQPRSPQSALAEVSDDAPEPAKPASSSGSGRYDDAYAPTDDIPF